MPRFSQANIVLGPSEATRLMAAITRQTPESAVIDAEDPEIELNAEGGGQDKDGLSSKTRHSCLFVLFVRHCRPFGQNTLAIRME